MIGVYVWCEHSNKENAPVFEMNGKHLSMVPSGYLCTDSVFLWAIKLSKWPAFDLDRFVSSLKTVTSKLCGFNEEEKNF